MSGVNTRVTGAVAGARSQLARLRGVAGQTTVEYLMIAGIFTAVAVFLLGRMPGALRTYARALIYSVRTVAP